MRVPIKEVLFAACWPACALAATGWQQALESVNLNLDPRIHVTGPREPGDANWTRRIEQGDVLIIEGESPLAISLGFRPTRQTVTVTSLRDVHAPDLRIILEKPIELSRWDVPAGAQVFTTERWTGAPVVAGYRSGKGAVLWSALDPGRMGYERFPYVIHALCDLGIEPLLRGNRLWAFFDSSYRMRVDVDYFARRWREAGISALHVAAWHFYDPNPEGDEYLRRLIAACHREGVMVYAWLELPHVSDKFWNDHPEWREKTAILQDAQLDWRKLMNLNNRDCFRMVSKGLSDLIFRFKWDGVNFAELYFESLEGASVPARFTPMSDEVRAQFRATPGGFDPIELWSKRKDPESLQRFLNFRADLARKMQEEWLYEGEKYRERARDLDIVLTHVDDRFDTRMHDAIGADASRVLPIMSRQDFTFLIEDPATIWNLGPLRYPEIARRYQPLTPRPDRLAVDINVVDRYQDVYPTKQQTGVELFELIHTAESAFSRVAVYFENSISPLDLKLLPAALASGVSMERNGQALTVTSCKGVGVRWPGPANVDGTPWPIYDGRTVWLPAGKHVINSGQAELPVRITSFNGVLLTAHVTGSAVEFEYESDSRSAALVSGRIGRASVDGHSAVILAAGDHTTLLLPRGRHRVDVTETEAVVP